MNQLRGPFFVRQSRGGNWDAVSAETAEDTSFPADVLADIYDLQGRISVWEIDTLESPDVDFLVAALHSGYGKPSEVTFRFVSEWRLKEVGLTKQKSRGGCLDSELNKSGKHWEIHTPTVKEAIVLAKSLKRLDPKFYTQDYVLQRFAISVQDEENRRF